MTTSSVNCKKRKHKWGVLCQVSTFLSIEVMPKYSFIAAKICSGKKKIDFSETFIKKAKKCGKKPRI